MTESRRAAPPPVALTIAGSDPSGGAGVQGDLKTFTALGAYGTAVIAALTAQSTQGVTGVHTVPSRFVTEQLHTLLADVAVDAAKIGMLASVDTITAVGQVLRAHADLPVVLDPVMVSTTGSRLLAEDAVEAMRALLPVASVVTPNIPEAAVLTGAAPARDLAEMRSQAATLREMGARRVLLKGGHLPGRVAVDLWADDAGEEVLTADRVDTTHTHGTGCALSAAIAALAPRTASLLEAARQAKAWLTGALQASGALRIGHGAGPVHHCYAVWQDDDRQQAVAGMGRGAQ